MANEYHLAELIFKHANRTATPFTSPLGQAWASIPLGVDSHQVWPVRSPRFRDWLVDSFYKEHEIFPRRRPLLDAIRMFESLAHTSNLNSPLPAHRLSACGDQFYPDAILLDLDNADRQSVEIRSDGWTVDTARNFFRHSRGDLPLPVPLHQPVGPHSLSPLQHLLGIDDPVHWTAIAAWIVSALRPTGPYPILIISGPPACGKTMLARMLRMLIDPCSAPLLPMPDSPRALLRLAWHYSVLAFDHVTRLAHPIAETLARISTGAGYSYSDPHDLREPLLTDVQRPIILTTPAGAIIPRPLSAAAVAMQLPAIPRLRVRPQANLWTDFHRIHPAVLGSLCSAVGTALARIRETEFAAATRFPDAASWTVAAAPALGLSQANIALALSTDPYVLALRDITAAAEGGVWSGSATDLLSAFRHRKIPALPATPKGLMQRLNRSPLAVYGIELDSSIVHDRRVIRATHRVRECVAFEPFSEATSSVSTT